MRFLKIFLISIPLFIVLSIIFTFVLKKIPVQRSPLMYIRCAQQRAEGKPMVLKHTWVKFEDISQNLVLAVMLAEDPKFPKHGGFDFEAIEKAMEHNKKSAKKIGASTISQQTAKNVYTWPGRDWIRKGFEAYFTVMIEFTWSKKRIIEVYLNTIEMGDGIYGAEAAAQHYFNKPAKELTIDEAARIATVLPNPRLYQVKNLGEKNKKKNKIVKWMRMFKSKLKELNETETSTPEDEATTKENTKQK